MGRKKAAAEKKLSGTENATRARTRLKKEAKSDHPAPPMQLSGNALMFYDRICKHLAENGVIQDVDALFVAQTAQNLHITAEAWAVIEKEGAVQETHSGYTQQTGHYTVWKNGLAIYKDQAAQLGLTVKARTLMLEVFGEEDNADHDPIADLMNMDVA